MIAFVYTEVQQNSRSLENLPPTQKMLRKHIKWASNCWKKALIAMQKLQIRCGERTLQVGNHYEPPFQKCPKHAYELIQLNVLGNASVWRLHLSAL